MRWFVIILFISPFVSLNNAVQCPINWISYGELCYYVNSTAELHYADADNACKELGAELTSIHSREEQDFLDQTVLSNNVRLWIGLNDMREEGTFEWVDGTEKDFVNWGPGQPDGRGGIEDCVHMVFRGTGRWNDHECFSPGPTYGYICKMRVPNTCEPPALTAGVVLGSTDTEFDVGEQLSFSCASTEGQIDGTTPITCQNVNGEAKGVWSSAPPTCVHYPMDWVSHKELRYYINFTAKLKYGDAENACKQLGAELASIHSQEEQDFLNQTVWRYGVRLWIGLNDRREEGVYEWVDGTELDYLNWGRGQPDDKRGIEECVHIIFKDTDGWNDIFCGGVQYGYICKKTVPNTCEPPAVMAGVVLGSTDTEFDIGEQLSFSCASTESHIAGTTTLTCQNVDGEATGVWSATPPTCGNTSKPEANVTPLPIIIVTAGVGGGVLLVLITAIVITVALRRSTNTTSSVTADDNDPDYAVPLENVGYDTYLDDNK